LCTGVSMATAADTVPANSPNVCVSSVCLVSTSVCLVCVSLAVSRVNAPFC